MSNLQIFEIKKRIFQKLFGGRCSGFGFRLRKP